MSTSSLSYSLFVSVPGTRDGIISTRFLCCSSNSNGDDNDDDDDDDDDDSSDR